MPIHIDMWGGLGNQLFQIATALELAKKLHTEATFSPQVTLGWRQDNYAKLLQLPCKEPGQWASYREPQFCYSPLPLQEPLRLFGYFQSDRYFPSCKADMEKLLSPWLPAAQALRQEFSGRTAAIHIRRGDYLNRPDVHPTCSPDYYRNLLEKHKDKYDSVLICSTDAEWCREHFPEYRLVETGAIETLLLMSLCEVILAANSSLSWWSGWLAKSGTLIELPKLWFGPNGPHDWTTIYYSLKGVEGAESICFIQE